MEVFLAVLLSASLCRVYGTVTLFPTTTVEQSITINSADLQTLTFSPQLSVSLASPLVSNSNFISTPTSTISMVSSSGDIISSGVVDIVTTQPPSSLTTLPPTPPPLLISPTSTSPAPTSPDPSFPISTSPAPTSPDLTSPISTSPTPISTSPPFTSPAISSSTVFTASSSSTSSMTVLPTNLPSSPVNSFTTTPATTDNEEGNDSGATFPPAAIVGIVIGGFITVIALILTAVLLVCFCCCSVRSKKYEYSTGNEHRMTVQQWNITSAHFNINRVDSVSSFGSSRSRGSSLFGSFGFMRRYSNSADHISSTSVGNQSVPDLYSTPL